MNKKVFFTSEFYENPKQTLDVLNQLVQQKQVAKKDMYQSGEFLYMEAFENEETKKLLSSVISDIEAYKAYNNDSYISDETTEIGLCALQDDHRSFFRNQEGDKEIRWNNDAEGFVFNENMPSKFY
jgi:hypothetical protein